VDFLNIERVSIYPPPIRMSTRTPHAMRVLIATVQTHRIALSAVLHEAKLCENVKKRSKNTCALDTDVN